MKNLKFLTQVDIEDLTDAIVTSKAQVKPRDIAVLEREGFVIVHGGDLTFSKLSDLVTQFKVKQIDKESWYIQRNDYTLTGAEYDLIMNSCRYSG